MKLNGSYQINLEKQKVAKEMAVIAKTLRLSKTLKSNKNEQNVFVLGWANQIGSKTYKNHPGACIFRYPRSNIERRRRPKIAV